MVAQDSNFPIETGEPAAELSADRYKQQKEIERQKRDAWLQRYVDLESLLYRGFLSTFCAVGSTRITLKSININEMDRIKYHVGSKEVNPYLYQLYFLAYSIFMIDDVNILPHRNDYFSTLIRGLRQVPLNVLSRLLLVLSDLNGKALQAGTLIEAYCYEDTSRQHWVSLKGFRITDSVVTGIEGTQNLGLNSCQRLWMQLNNFEDLKVQREIDWDYAKFIGSCTNPKGVRQIDQNDKTRRQSEQDERELIRLGGVREDGDVIKFQAQSVEELLGELERSLKGEKDWHDDIVDDTEQKMRDDLEQRKAEYITELEQHHVEELDNSSLADKKVFSLEEAQRSLDHRRHQADSSPASQRLYEMQQAQRLADRSNTKQYRDLNTLAAQNPSMNTNIIDTLEVEKPDISNK